MKRFAIKTLLTAAVSLVLSGPVAVSAGSVGFANIYPGSGVIHRPVTSMRGMKYKDLIEQQTDFSCGAAALATIMKYAYGLQVTEHDMLEGMFAVSDPEQVRRQGFSLLNIKHYVERLGMRGRGYQVTAEALDRIKIPTIVLLDLQGYKHFVVLKKTWEDRVYIGDPALGNKVMKRDQFLNSWNGVVFAVIGKGLDKNSVLINPPEPLTARNLSDVRAPLTNADLLDFGFKHSELF